MARSAQSIGKKLLGIQIVNVDGGQPASFVKAALARELPVTVLTLIPSDLKFLVAMADVTAIFRRDRRCIHDHIAGTRVVRLPARRSGVSASA